MNYRQHTIDFDSAVFSGSDYVEEFDKCRLTGQILAIYDLMQDGKWRTLDEIENAFSGRYGQASISAQLRNLRKASFGRHTIVKRRRGDDRAGLFEYQLIPSNYKPISNT